MSAKIVKRQQLFFSPPQQDSSGFPNQFFNRYPQFDQQQNNFQGNQVFNQNQRPAFGNQQIPNQNNNNNRQVSTTAVPRTTLQPTTLSPAVQQCTDGCVTQTTSEYNPVCGSDNQNYHNPARLECAQQCGVSKCIL